MKFTVKALAAVTFLADMGVSAAAGTMEGQAAGQLRSFGSLADFKAAAGLPVPMPAKLTRDIFREVDACSALNNQFVMQPMMKDALSMLKPCLDGVSKMTGNARISAGAVKNGKAIEIVVLGEKNEAVKELVRGSLAKRNNQIFGYPAAAVVHAAAPISAARFVYADVFSQVPACSVVDAQFVMQPLMKDALNMLKPCLEGVSKLTEAPVSANETNFGRAIEIVVLGEKNENVIPLLNSTIIKRHNHLFGYPATVVLHAASPL